MLIPLLPRIYPMATTLKCPGCNTKLTVGDDRAGTTFACPRCSAAVVVPGPRAPSSLPRPSHSPLPIAAARPRPVPKSAADPTKASDHERRGVRNAISANRWVLGGVLLFVLGVVAAVGVRAALNATNPSSDGMAGVSETLPPRRTPVATAPTGRTENCSITSGRAGWS